MMPTTTANPCAPDEDFWGYEGPDLHPVCVPVATLPVQPPLPTFVLPETVDTPTPVDPATCWPFPACARVDTTPTTTTDTAPTTATATVPAGVPATVDTTRPSVADTLLVPALTVAIVAALVGVGVVAVKRDASTRAVWRVVSTGCRRVGWPFVWAWGRNLWRARLLLIVVLLLAYSYVLANVAAVLGSGLLTLALLAAAVLLAGEVWRLWIVRTEPEAPAWWSERVLVSALSRAKAVPTDAVLGRIGAPAHDDAGTSIVVRLPSGCTVSSLAARHEDIAAELGVPVARLELAGVPEQPPNICKITVLEPRSHVARTPAVAGASGTDGSRPVPLGLDAKGRPVHFTTSETHTVLAGGTGSGKTTLAHLVVAHAALDLRVRLFGIDGKGDAGRRGWQPLEPRCEAFVRGMGAGSPARVEALLTAVTELAEQRGADGDEAPEVVLILEEWATARTVLRRLDKAAADRCDGLVTVLLATARSRGVHVIVIVQRGTATAFPVDQRANCGQRIVGKFGDSAELGYVLESTPATLPGKAGEFAVSLDGAPPTLVAVDHLTPEAWQAVCARAASLRPAGPTSVPEPASGATVAPAEAVDVEPVEAPLDPLLSAVLDLLADAGRDGLSATTLHERLPEHLLPGTVAQLGKALRTWPEHLRPGSVKGGGRTWRAVVAPSSPRRPTATPTDDDGADKRGSDAGVASGDSPSSRTAGGAA